MSSADYMWNITLVATEALGEIHQPRSHVHLKKVIVLSFKPLRKVAGPDLFMIGLRLAVKINVPVVVGP